MSTGGWYTVNLGPVGRVVQAVGEVDPGRPGSRRRGSTEISARAPIGLPGATATLDAGDQRRGAEETVTSNAKCAPSFYRQNPSLR
jgi:hypothetical protein